MFPGHPVWLLLTLLAITGECCIAQRVIFRPAPSLRLPPVIDGNSAAFWAGDEMALFHSTGVPSISRGPDQFQLSAGEPVSFDSTHHPVWFEAAWRDEDGTLLLWYHHEPASVCGGNSLTAPKIGAAVSYDNGVTVRDLGIVLEAGYPLVCSAKNGFFAGGHGDFSVILDRESKFFYFFFTNYSGPVSEQGIATARMAFEDRYQPAGAVQKYYQGDWSQPGIGGRVSPVFPAWRAWENADTNSFWGPSIHWNTFLEQYVIFLNHACCEPNWPQEGIYVTFNADLRKPESWITPLRVLSKKQIPSGAGYYPQVLGLNVGESDTIAGEVARFYVHGHSIWEAVFVKPGSEAPADPEPEPEPPDETELPDVYAAPRPNR